MALELFWVASLLGVFRWGASPLWAIFAFSKIHPIPSVNCVVQRRKWWQGLWNEELSQRFSIQFFVFNSISFTALRRPFSTIHSTPSVAHLIRRISGYIRVSALLLGVWTLANKFDHRLVHFKYWKIWFFWGIKFASTQLPRNVPHKVLRRTEKVATLEGMKFRKLSLISKMLGRESSVRVERWMVGKCCWGSFCCRHWWLLRGRNILFRMNGLGQHQS